MSVNGGGIIRGIDASATAAAIRAVVEIPLGPVRLYALGGGGLDFLSGQAQTAVSAYGYEVELAVPDRRIRPLAEAGGGLKLFLGARFGLRAEVRYAMIFAEPGTIKTLHAEGGVLIKI